MAPPDHLKILKQGVDVWNRWRMDNRNERPYLPAAKLSGVDLSNAFLSNANLGGADLSNANLSRVEFANSWLNQANLSGSDLSHSDFRGAYVAKVNLSDSDLSGVVCIDTDLNRANLTNANLSGGHLVRVNLESAKLSGANFTHARIGHVTLANVDLREVVGLTEVYHEGPSSIGIDTVYKSKGEIPKAFLRGCGAPDNFIEYMHDLTETAFQLYSCFISYSHKDEECATRIHSDLEDNGVRSWFACKDMKIGDPIEKTIQESLRLYDKTLVILSQESVNSEWVEHEVELALKEEQNTGQSKLFPIRIDDAVMGSKALWATKVRKRHIGNFTEWKEHDSYQKAFQKLLADLKEDQ